MTTSAYPTSAAVGISLFCNLFLSGQESQTKTANALIYNMTWRQAETDAQRERESEVVWEENCSVNTSPLLALLHQVTVYELTQPQETDVLVCRIVIING